MNITGTNDTNASTSEPNLDLRTFERFRFVVNTLLIRVTGAQRELIISEITSYGGMCIVLFSYNVSDTADEK